MASEHKQDRAAAAPPPGAAPEDPPTKGDGWGDYVVPGFIFVFCAVVTYLCTTFEEALPIIVGYSMQPRVFPIFLMAVIASLNVFLILQVLRRPLANRDWEPRTTWATVALMPLFYLITEHVDIILSLIVTMFLMALVWGERRWWAAALTALCTAGFIFFTLDLVLEVRFPRGLLTGWYYG